MIFSIHSIVNQLTSKNDVIDDFKGWLKKLLFVYVEICFAWYGF